MPKKYKIGQVVGGVTIIKKVPDEKYNKYLLKCNTCGNEFVEYATSVRKHVNGCVQCKYRKNREKYYTKEIGKTYGNLKIVGYDEDESDAQKRTYVKCQCLKCNAITSIPMARIKAGQAKECVTCAKENLQIGRDLAQEDRIDGTRVTCIMKKTINKNNTSGYKGVSMCKNGKYRAYINFQRKQYHLGTYMTAEDAHKIRLLAEEKIYGKFLEWYASEFPEKWEKIQAKINKI